MSKLKQDSDQISDSVNLLISILVRYPEIATIKFDSGQEVLKLTFMLSKINSISQMMSSKKLIFDSIHTLHKLQGVSNATIHLNIESFENIGILTVVRDLSTLSIGEIALIITLLHEYFKDSLVSDTNETLMEEDLMLQEEIIDTILKNMEQQKDTPNLIGIREDGRVLVFNK